MSTLLVRAESRTSHPFFEHWVCNSTSASKRDNEPAVHFLSKKGTAAVAFREVGNNCGTVAGKVIF